MMGRGPVLASEAEPVQEGQQAFRTKGGLFRPQDRVQGSHWQRSRGGRHYSDQRAVAHAFRHGHPVRGAAVFGPAVAGQKLDELKP